jgi:hypothetical protein
MKPKAKHIYINILTLSAENLTSSHFLRCSAQAFNISVLELSIVSPVVGDVQRYFT